MKQTNQLNIRCSAISSLDIKIVKKENIVGKFSNFQSMTANDAISFARFLRENSSEVFYRALLTELINVRK